MGDEQRDERRSTKAERKEPLERRARRAFLDGAEEESQRAMGRGLTHEELKRVLRRYPGDP